MTRFNPVFNRLRSSLLLLALVAVVLRGLVPLGFMPDMSRDAGTALVICSGNDTQTIYLDQDGNPAPQDAAHTESNPCDFSFAPLAFEPFLPQIVPMPAIRVAAFSIPVPEIKAHSFELLPYSSRAPPASLV